MGFGSNGNHVTEKFKKINLDLNLSRNFYSPSFSILENVESRIEVESDATRTTHKKKRQHENILIDSY